MGELAMRVTRRTALQASLLGVAGLLRATPTTAQSQSTGPTPAERERLAHLAADLMDWYEALCAISRHCDEGRAGLPRSLWICGQGEARAAHKAASFSDCERHQAHMLSRGFYC